MANKINIAQVPEVATISQLLGVDANNKWAKIPGAKFATAEQLTAVDNKATNAQTAANAATQTANQASGTAASANQTAASAKSTAEGIDGKATQALTNSQTAVSTANAAKTAAEKNDALLMGADRWLNAGDITIYTGNWVNGTLDPKPSLGQLNSKYRCLSIEYNTPDTRMLILKGLVDFAASKLHGTLVVVVRGGGELRLTVPEQGDQGHIVPVDQSNNGNGLALYVFSIELCELYCVVDCLYNCAFEQAKPLQILLNAERGGGGAITVDSSLSTTSTNPVENKTVTAALNLKAPLASPAFSGTPTAPTPDVKDRSTKLATTAFVKNITGSFLTSVYKLFVETATSQKITINMDILSPFQKFVIVPYTNSNVTAVDIGTNVIPTGDFLFSARIAFYKELIKTSSYGDACAIMINGASVGVLDGRYIDKYTHSNLGWCYLDIDIMYANNRLLITFQADNGVLQGSLTPTSVTGLSLDSETHETAGLPKELEGLPIIVIEGEDIGWGATQVKTEPTEKEE